MQKKVNRAFGQKNKQLPYSTAPFPLAVNFVLTKSFIYNYSFTYYSFTVGVEDIFPSCGSVQVILVKSLFLLQYVNVINAHCLNIAFKTSEAYGIIIWGNCNNYDNIKSLQALSYSAELERKFLTYHGIHNRKKPGKTIEDNYCKQRRDIAILS